jgi:hypothetical protein
LSGTPKNSFRKKIVEIPIKIHLFKYLQVHGKWNDYYLDVRKSFFPLKGKSDNERIDAYFNKTEKKVMISVLMDPSSRAYQYTMVQYFDEQFKKEMFAHIDARIELEGVFKPLRGFYSKYSIYPSDYDFDTAFKRYQREIVRRQNKPLL